MKNITAIFMIGFAIGPIFSSRAAITIKKADSVEVKKTTASKSSAASLVPTVLGLVSGVIDMKKQQKSLSADCVPSKKERAFVDKMMKEWAKSGKGLSDIEKELNREACPAENGSGYKMDVQMSEAAGAAAPCYNSFKGPGNEFMIWENYPRVGFAQYKDSDGKQITKSDTYDLFALIDFEPVDYRSDELTMAGNLLQKVENCSSARLNAKKKALWGTFLLNTAGGVGQKTDTSTILQQVSGITSSGGSVGSSLGTAASQMLLMKVAGGE